MIFDADGKFFNREGITLDQLELHGTGQMLNQKDSLAHNGIENGEVRDLVLLSREQVEMQRQNELSQIELQKTANARIHIHTSWCINDKSHHQIRDSTSAKIFITLTDDPNL